MSDTNFLPRKDADLVLWSGNFSAKILLAPPSYGLTIPQATAYQTLHNAFVAAWNTVNAPGSNSSANVVAKNVAREALETSARLLAREIQGTPTVTDFQKTDIGLTVRDVEPSPVPIPEVAPALTIESSAGRSVRLRLQDVENPDRRGKPDGVSGATILIFVGDNPPANPREWSFLMSTTRTIVDITWPPDIASGALVHLTAFWFNTKAEASPAANWQIVRVGDAMAKAQAA